jgi:hypothetical protein
VGRHLAATTPHHYTPHHLQPCLQTSQATGSHMLLWSYIRVGLEEGEPWEREKKSVTCSPCLL